MKGYNKFNEVREMVGDSVLLDELIQILSDDQLDEFADDLIRNLDLDMNDDEDY